MLRTSIVRAARSSASLAAIPSTRQAVHRAAPAVCAQQQQIRKAHAISNPTLANIERRWEEMPPQEQADLWMSLRDRMKADWKELTLQEKKAAYYIAFGPHGPRRPPPADEGRKVIFITLATIAGSVALFFFTRMFASPHRPKTMTKEWQEATEEYMQAQGTEPITFKKGMMVQSLPAAQQTKQPKPEE
ncbi:COX4-domain-containing protein [Sporormia fimetaria CBS 119925]|uniref:Cytochrome c oxidase polypeptide V n=1 Tax=Sporormia fimetaria CBS 119925 TaxID=1340428 RepID=A0A6A6V3J0_9PLEO|nr:COX4-domain-containing protein [Sporormia fimetaria CBS 119925]